jgi:hypothetical protein
MASIYKTFTSNDIVSKRDLLHEAIPLTGTIVSGTYSDNNIKVYSAHDMFESVFDYPFLSSSANHIFDLTAGFAADSGLSASATVASLDPSKKINIYNQMAQILVGFDETGSVKRFDRDGDLTSGTKIKEAYFINFARLLTKDEIKKQSFTIQFLTGGTVSAPTDLITISDYGALNSYKVNSPAGEYGILYTGSTNINANSGVGLIYYQAGICVLTASIFDGNASNYIGPHGANGAAASDNKNTSAKLLVSGSISGSADALRNRLHNISFNNTIEINSTIYFCRANNSEFNYSSNPTYLSSSQIVVKDNAEELPRSYVTSVGLYSADNELLATAKLSEPLEKDPTDEFTLRVRLDY